MPAETLENFSLKASKEPQVFSISASSSPRERERVQQCQRQRMALGIFFPIPVGGLPPPSLLGARLTQKMEWFRWPVCVWMRHQQNQGKISPRWLTAAVELDGALQRNGAGQIARLDGLVVLLLGRVQVLDVGLERSRGVRARIQQDGNPITQTAKPTAWCLVWCSSIMALEMVGSCVCKSAW